MTTTLPAGWKPIESAPKDGTEILAWRSDCGQFIASYTSADAFPMTQDELDAMDEETLFAKDWFTQWPDATRLDGSEAPTLWQPLPAEPCQTCNDQGAIGNILTAEPCPDCTPPATTQDDTLARTGNTADHQNGWFAGVDHGRAEGRAGAQDDAKDERTRVMEVIAGVWDRATQIDDAADEVIDLLRAPAAGDALDAARWRSFRKAITQRDEEWLNRMDSALTAMGLDPEGEQLPSDEQVDAAADLARQHKGDA